MYANAARNTHTSRAFNPILRKNIMHLLYLIKSSFLKIRKVEEDPPSNNNKILKTPNKILRVRKIGKKYAIDIIIVSIHNNI